MKKSIVLFLAFCGVITLLIAPGIVAADTFVFPSDPNGVGAYRAFGNLAGYEAALAIVDLTNAVELPETAHVAYTPPNSNSPGWVDPTYDWAGGQHTYIINLPSPTGGQLPYVPALHPQSGVSGLLALYDTPTPPTLPTTLSGWENPTFLSQVSAVVAFTPGVSTALVFEKNSQVPEPGVLLLLGCGLISLAGMRRAIKK